MEMMTRSRILHSDKEALSRALNQESRLVGNLSDSVRPGRVGMITPIDDPGVQADNVALRQDPVL